MSTVAPLRFSLPSPSQDMVLDDEALMLHSKYHVVCTPDVTRGHSPRNSALPTVVEVIPDGIIRPDDMAPARFPAFPDGAFGDNGVASGSHLLDPLCRWPDSPCGLPSTCLVSPGVHDPGHHHAEPSDGGPLLPASHPPSASSSNDRSVTEPCTSPYPPPHLSSGPSSPPSLPDPESLGSVPRFCVVPHQDSIALSRRSQGARAIYHGGIWLDEQELLTALKDSNGNLYVFRCCLEADRSPCHLWIKGEKSSINVHMQKWHGDKPGGDKSEVSCRWSNCAKKMLKESITRHIVRAHLGEVWECLACQKRTTRNDAHRRHTSTSDVEACRTSGALTMYSVDVVVVDAQVALEGGGHVQDANA